MMKPTPIPPQPGQESVWDYPRPARWEDTPKHLKVVFNGVVLADTHRGKRVLETSHPPTYYFPPEDINFDYLVATPRKTLCEWKGQASYYTVTVGDKCVENAVWSVYQPTTLFLALKGYCAFYPRLMEACYVDGELVTPQAGSLYGGWITKDLAGPFKGAPGTGWW